MGTHVAACLSARLVIAGVRVSEEMSGRAMPARRIRGAAAAGEGGGGGGGEGTPSLSTVETTAPTPPYTPSPMDASLIAPQLFAMVFILGAAAYLQVFVTGTARARFDKADPQRRAFVETTGATEAKASRAGWSANWPGRGEPGRGATGPGEVR